MGFVLVRVSFKTFYIYLYRQIDCEPVAIRTRLIPDLASVDGDTGLEAVLQFLGLQVSFKRFIWTPATWEVAPLISHKAGRQAGACMNLLGNLGWLAREEVQ